MNRRIIIAGAAIVLLGCALFWYLRRSSTHADKAWPQTKSVDQSQTIEKSKDPEGPASSVNNPKGPSGIPDTYPLWKGGRAIGLDDPRWKIRREREKLDPAWQGKMPIEFYGKVVDEKGRPVSEADIAFVWTDLSAEGTSKQKAKSDSNGLFALHGVLGKNLGVNVTKDGYYTALQKQYGFEYASFGDDQYYEPDAANPVIFHLRRKGNTEALLYKEKEIKIVVGTPVSVPVYGGTAIRILLQSNQHPKNGRWESQVSVQNGGLIPATEEFITEAPVNGYQAEMTVNPQTPKPPTWELYQGGSFYVKAGQNYGRLDIEMIPGNDWLRVTTWINSTAGSRNVEVDLAKQIPVKP